MNYQYNDNQWTSRREFKRFRNNVYEYTSENVHCSPEHHAMKSIG